MKVTPDFRPEYPPWAHQLDIYNKRADLDADCLFVDMGGGKSAICIHQICKKYLQKKIDGVLILAPNGVHKDWVLEHLPKHVWNSVLPQMQALYWVSNKAGSQRAARDAEALLRHKGLAVLTMTYEGILTERGRAFAKKFLTQRKCLYALDESHFIKTPGSKRTKTILASASYAPYRRVLTGTPASSGKPFDVYTQCKFAHPDFWKSKGLSSFHAFKTFFGIWQPGFNSMTGRSFDQCVGYQNLTLLEKWLKEVSIRVEIDDVLDLPPAIYATPRRFEMTDEQKRIYNQLAQDFIAEFQGREIAAPIAIVRMLRFQQVTCGYLPIDDVDADGFPTGDKVLVSIDGGNPRLRLLEEIVEGISKKTVIWARFTEDITQIMALLTAAGRKAVRYDGQVKDKERTANKREFAEGEAEFFVGNQAAGGTGLDGLQVAHYSIYYSNSLKLVDRNQSERRTYRGGQKNSHVYVDIYAEKSIDRHILEVLRQGLDVSRAITGDAARSWVQTI